MSYLLDTNHCFRVIAKDTRMLAALEERSSANVMTSVVVAGELRYGALISDQLEENIVAVEDFLVQIDQVAISPAISQVYAGLKARLLWTLGPKDRSSRRGFALTTLGFTDNDLWIAASALEREAVVVSEDRDFRRLSAALAAARGISHRNNIFVSRDGQVHLANDQESLKSLNVENWLS